MQRKLEFVCSSFSHPDCNCRFRILTESAAYAGRGLRRSITAGRDFHPAPKDENDRIHLFF